MVLVVDTAKAGIQAIVGLPFVVNGRLYNCAVWGQSWALCPSSFCRRAVSSMRSAGLLLVRRYRHGVASDIDLSRRERRFSVIRVGLGYEPEFHLSTARLLGQAPSGDEVSHRVADGWGTGGRYRPWALGQRRDEAGAGLGQETVI
jgi:hypothetical protein